MGFTLIELLVVISVIALLATLLMSSLSMVQDAALRTTCAGHMRQVYMALDVYRTENTGMYPQIYWDDPSWSTWSTWTYQTTHGRWQHVLHDYTDTYQIFNCPKLKRMYPKSAVLEHDKDGTPAGAAPGGGWTGWGVCAMAYNSQCFGRAGTWTWAVAPSGKAYRGPMTESSADGYIKNRIATGTVSRCPVFMDGIWQNDGTNQVMNSWGAYFPHRLKANMVFSDGHAEIRSQQDVILYDALQIRD